MPSYQQGENPIIQNCSCARCSAVRTQAGPPAWYPWYPEQQDPRHIGVSGLDDDLRLISLSLKRAGTPYSVGAQGFAPAQTAVSAKNRPHKHVMTIHEGPPNMGFPTARTLDTSIAEGRRRLAGQYLNNPDAFVRTIRLEPGPSSQFQAIITLEMTNVI